MSKKHRVSRRQAVKQGALAASSFFIVPRHVLGRGFKAPSDKLNLASIGAGGKGSSDILHSWNKGAENVVALCDVDKNRAENSIQKFDKAKVFSDYRVMLEEMKDDIDACVISAPDHIHAVAAMAAMQLGKHVYVQKPLTHSIYEARMLTETARAQKVVTQMGNQGASSPDQKLLAEWFDKGLIGAVHTVEVWTNRPVWPQGIPVPSGKMDLPAAMNAKDWDHFIGPAQMVDYDPLYHPFKWRGWWNFGTGALGDMGCHLIDQPFRVLKLGYPTEVECSVGQVFIKDWDAEYIPEGCPPSSRVELKFLASDHNASDIKMRWHDGGLRPFHPDLIPADDFLGEPGSGNGVMMIGEKGIITCGTYGRHPQLYLKNGDKIGKPDNYGEDNPYAKLPENGHHTAWVDACKEGFGGKLHQELTSSFDYSGPLTETVIMGNLAIRSYMDGNRNAKGDLKFDGRKKLLWDGEKMEITNYEPAAKFVRREYRKGWSLA